MSQITFDVPDAALDDLRQDPDAAAREVRVAMAIGLYAEGRLSHSQACQFSGLGRVIFSERLHAAHIPEHYVTTKDFDLEFAGA